MKTRVLFLFLISLHFISNSNPHPNHISVFTVEFNPESKAFEISIKVNTEDLESTLNLITNNSSNAINKTDSIISRYLYNNLRFNFPQSKINLAYIGKEYEDNYVFLFIESESIELKSELTFFCSFLTETIHHQSNIFHFKFDNMKISEVLDANKNRATIAID